MMNGPEQEHVLALTAADGTRLDYTASLDVLPDGDPTDNEKDVVLWLASDPDGTIFYDFTVTLKELPLTPLSLTVHYTATQPNDPRVWPSVGPLEVVLKDGSTVTALKRSAPDMNGCTVLVFDEPLDLKQVAYVQYGTHRIELPEF